MQDLKVLLLQTDIFWEDPQKNRDNIENKIKGAFSNHDLIILPETFTTGFPVNPDKFAETNNGPTLRWMKKIAQDTQAVIAGSLLTDNNNSYSNTFVWIFPEEETICYNKRHVFSMGGEHKKITPGISRQIITLKGWKILPQVCYDLRFPVWSKNNFRNNQFEYDLAIYTANWPAVRSYPWKSLLVARAIENQSYVIGVNRVGNDGPGNTYSGDSMAVSPKGEILKAGKEFTEENITALLSAKDINKFRSNFNVGNDWDKFQIIQ